MKTIELNDGGFITVAEIAAAEYYEYHSELEINSILFYLKSGGTVAKSGLSGEYAQLLLEKIRSEINNG